MPKVKQEMYHSKLLHVQVAISINITEVPHPTQHIHGKFGVYQHLQEQNTAFMRYPQATTDKDILISGLSLSNAKSLVKYVKENHKLTGLTLSPDSRPLTGCSPLNIWSYFIFSEGCNTITTS